MLPARNPTAIQPPGQPAGATAGAAGGVMRHPGGIPRRAWAAASEPRSAEPHAGTGATSSEPAPRGGPGGSERASWDPGRVVLVVDDEPGIVESLDKIFRREGFTVLTATDGATGLDLLRRHRVGVLLSDLMMPGTSGMDLLRAARTVAPETEVILMTAYGTVETAVDAMKEGAYDFVAKPLKRAHVVRVVRNALEKQLLVTENRALKAQLTERRRRSIIGTSLPWRRTMDIVHQAAPSEATVLLLGESGTGKELLARAVHDNSTRARGPFIAINCAAIPESILEAELFGYERGAFTGATAAREGRFEAAHGGTLFLDEIGEISRHVQVKLLRVLQEGEIERLGAGGKPRRIDLRLIAATNVDLAEEVRAGRFREDLYYRLNVIPVHVPPLRDRREDVPLLVQHFIQLYAEKNGKTITGCTAAAMARLADYPWPGNVRELENAIERAVVLTRASVPSPLDEDALPREIRDAAAAGAPAMTFAIGTPLADIEMRVIRETLRHTRGDKRLTAKLLGIATRTIYRRLEALGEPADGEPEPADGSPDADGAEPADADDGDATDPHADVDLDAGGRNPVDRAGAARPGGA
ncbi:MAG TPA: sigma-54 dependent transcriptional regulator [Kofleriaceae bacterium]|nr:sigma-54 dependent transcriptional regulator [Kofleriaceae bacterium]